MAALTTENFREAQPSELNLFSLPPTQTAVERVYYQDIRSTSQINGNAPIEFLITGQNGMEFLDLKRSKLYIKVKILRNGEVLDHSTRSVGPVNVLFHSMFSQVDMTIQGKLITSTTNHHPYRAMINTLLSYSSQAKSSQLTSLMWFKDSPGHLDDPDPENGLNGGLTYRSQYFVGSKSVDMEGPILHDLFQIERYVLNQVAIGVKFYRSRPEFCLMTNDDTENYQLEIEDIYLKACKVAVNAGVIYGQAEVMKTVNAKYPFTKTEVKQLTIPAGNISFTYDNLFQGVRPNRCIIAFVKAAAAAGNYKLNPFNFQHFNLTQIGVFVDGIPVGGNVLKLNFDLTVGRSVVPAFNSMFDVTNKWMTDSDNQVNRTEYAGGYALYCFQIEPNFGNDVDHLTLLKQGNVRLEAQFSNALSEATTCIIYAEYPGYFEINAARDILLE